MVAGSASGYHVLALNVDPWVGDRCCHMTMTTSEPCPSLEPSQGGALPMEQPDRRANKPESTTGNLFTTSSGGQGSDSKGEPTNSPKNSKRWDPPLRSTYMLQRSHQ